MAGLVDPETWERDVSADHRSPRLQRWQQIQRRSGVVGVVVVGGVAGVGVAADHGPTRLQRWQQIQRRSGAKQPTKRCKDWITVVGVFPCPFGSVLSEPRWNLFFFGVKDITNLLYLKKTFKLAQPHCRLSRLFYLPLKKCELGRVDCNECIFNFKCETNLNLLISGDQLVVANGLQFNWTRLRKQQLWILHQLTQISVTEWVLQTNWHRIEK